MEAEIKYLNLFSVQHVCNYCIVHVIQSWHVLDIQYIKCLLTVFKLIHHKNKLLRHLFLNSPKLSISILGLAYLIWFKGQIIFLLQST